MIVAKAHSNPWPTLLQRHASQVAGSNLEYLPRRVRRRFHTIDLTMWQGFVHVDDIEGYCDNVRLKYYLNSWLAQQGGVPRMPTSDEIYEIMTEADADESSESRRPFQVERMAQNIARNGIQEPIIVFDVGNAKAELWDGNRRFYGTKHIMKSATLSRYRDQAQWLPALVVTPSGDPATDDAVKHAILTECNFVEKDHIPWPAYVKAEQIYNKYQIRTSSEPGDHVLARQVKETLAREYGLKGWRQADRWIKMYARAHQFKEYHEEEHGRDSVDVDLLIQEKFEYFDELSKPGVWGALATDPDARDEVFQWLWDGKFKSFVDVRAVPKILGDPVARRQANAPDVEGVKRGIATVIVNDPTRTKDKEAANEKIQQFSKWVDSFRREDFKELNREALTTLKSILQDVTKMLEGLFAEDDAVGRPSVGADV